ncbi:MAG: extracellular solute-binding protein [Fibrobacterales bacterium]
MTRLISCITFFALFCIVSAHAKPVTLKMWIMNNGSRAVWQLQQTTEAFQKQHPHIKLDIQLVNWGEAWTKLKILSQTHSGPDIVQVGSTWVPHFAETDLFLNLKPYLTQFGGKESFFSSAWSSSFSDNHPQMIAAVPWFLDNKILMLNQEMFNAFNFTTRDFKDWKSTKNSLMRVKEAQLTTPTGDQIWPFAFPGFGTYNVVHNLAPWLWSSGGSFLKKGGAHWHSNLSDTNSIEAIKYYISLMRDSIVNARDLDQSNTYVDNLFVEGKVFLYLTGTGQLVSDARGDKSPYPFSTTYLPTPQSTRGTKQQFSFLGGSNLAITRFSKHRNEAIALITYLMNDKVNAEYSTAIGAISSKKHFKRYLPHVDSAAIYLLESSVTQGRSYPNIPQWGDLVLPIKDGLVSLFLLAGGAYGEYGDEEVLEQTLAIDRIINKRLGLSIATQDSLAQSYQQTFIQKQRNRTTPFAQTFSQRPQERWFEATLLIICILLLGGVVALKRIGQNR